MKEGDYLSRSMHDADPEMLKESFLEFLNTVDLDNPPEYNREEQLAKEKVARDKLNVSVIFSRFAYYDRNPKSDFWNVF